MKKLPALILFIFVFFFISVKSASATVLFEDNFEDGNADGWEVEHWTPDPSNPVWQTTKWTVNSDKQYGIILNGRQMRTFSSTGDIAWSDYVYKAQMLGKAGVDKNIVFRYQNKNNWYGLHMISSGVYLGKNINGNYSDLLYVDDINFSNNVFYDLEIRIVGNSVSFYVNNSPIIQNYVISGNPFPNGKIGLYVSTGEARPSSIWFDNILVCDFEGPCESTPTPTPTLQPLIFLPGLGASWNHEAMILDQEKPPDEWYMTPGVKSYDGIIQTFQNAGYTLGDDFFVFNYDWRQPIEDIAEDLENYIDTKINPPPEAEIDLVGHSLGGMVARTYVQNNPEDHQVDQLLSLGSPHHGAPQTYYLWEGADLNKTFKYAWQRIGVGILIQLKKRGFENNVETVHNIAPVIGNLLPDFPYLKESGSPKPLSEMSQRNTWLEGLNILPLPEHLTSRLVAVLGSKGDTLRWINIQSRSWFDRLLGRWEDGKPIDEEFEIGDESVLVESGQLEGATVEELINLNHGELVESSTGQEKVMEILELSPSEVVEAPDTLSEPFLVFQLTSPANITIFGPSGWQIGEGVINNIPGSLYSPGDKLIIIPSPLEGDYEVQVKGENGGGNYRLLIGNINQENDIWREESGQVGDGETKVHQITFSKDQKANKLDLLKHAQEKLQKAKETANNCGYFSRLTLKGLIQQKLFQIRKIIYLLRFGRERWAEKELKETIRGIIKLERSLDYFGRRCAPETQEDILFLLRETRDYLIQAKEL